MKIMIIIYFCRFLDFLPTNYYFDSKVITSTPAMFALLFNANNIVYFTMFAAEYAFI